MYSYVMEQPITSMISSVIIVRSAIRSIARLNRHRNGTLFEIVYAQSTNPLILLGNTIREGFVMA